MSFPITLTYARNESRGGMDFVVNSDAIDIVQPSIDDTPTSIRLRSGQTVYVAESVENVRRAMPEVGAVTPELALELICGRLQMFFPQGWDESREVLMALGYTAEEIDESVRKYLGN